MVRGNSVWGVSLDMQELVNEPVGGLLFHQSLAADRKVSPYKKHNVTPLAEDPDTPGCRLLNHLLNHDSEGFLEVLNQADIEAVNYQGARQVKVSTWEVEPSVNGPLSVLFSHTEYRSDCTPLFAAAQSGEEETVKRLLAAGADPNARVFRGFPSTVAAQEGHSGVVRLLVERGRLTLEAIEEALLEAALHNQPEVLKILLDCKVAQDPTLQQALVQASSRGFLDIVQLLIKSGVNPNCSYRILVQCAHPPLHLNATCTPLIAAVMSFHKEVVDVLLEAGASETSKASLGSWTWNQTGLEELKVGAGLGEPYSAPWAAVEYCRGPIGAEILQALLKRSDVKDEIEGRTLLFHAVLCKNAAAVSALLKAGTESERCARSPSNQQQFRPLHLAARLGDVSVVNALLNGGCNIDSRDDSGKTPVMIAAENGKETVLETLITAGAELGLVDVDKRSLVDIADASGNGARIRSSILRQLAHRRPRSSDERVFHPLLFAAAEGDVFVIRRLLGLDDQETDKGAWGTDNSGSPTSILRAPESPNEQSPGTPLQTAQRPQDGPPLGIDAQDSNGNTALILCTQQAHLNALQVLLRAGASVGIENVRGESVLTVAQQNGLLEDVADLILEALRDNWLRDSPGFFPLHFASSCKDERTLACLLERKLAVDAFDNEGLTPIMICAQKGFTEGCRMLLEAGANAEKRSKVNGLTALQLAREQGPEVSAAVEKALFEHLARKLVLSGGPLLKHTREGRGKPHEKTPSMASGAFSWGDRDTRKLTDVVAEIGGGTAFKKNRPKDSGALLERSFSVEARGGRVVYFTAASKDEAEMWVHGINLMAQEVDGRSKKAV